VAADETMKRRPGFLLILLTVFIVLAAIVWLQGPQRQPAVSQRISATNESIFSQFPRVYPNLTEAELQAIQIEVPSTGQSFTIARDDQRRWFAPGYEGALDPEAAIVIPRTIQYLIYTSTVPYPENGDLRQYGLAPLPVVLISFITINGQQHVIATGYDAAPGYIDFYALVDNREEIYLLQRSPIDQITSYLENPPIVP
jgi:hypothetical protein